jgi:ribonuclease HI
MQGLRGLSFAIAEACIRHGLRSARLFPVPAACVVFGDRSLRCVPAMTRRGGVGKAQSGRAQARFYAVHHGRDGFRGILSDWSACKNVVDRVPGAVFKAFASRADAVAFAEHGYATGDAPSVEPETIAPTRGGLAVRGSNSVTFSQPSVSEMKQLVVYTDGACVGNGRTGARAGVGVYFGDGDHSVYNTSQPLMGPVQTNQRAELTGVLLALRISLENGLVKPGECLLVKTDSKVRMQCFEWHAAQQRNLISVIVAIDRT